MESSKVKKSSSSSSRSKKNIKGGEGNKSQRGSPQKRNQELWEDVLKAIRAFSRESGLSTSESNPILSLAEKYAEQGYFPPKQLIIGDTNNACDASWVRVLCQSLICGASAKYQAQFESKKYQGLKALCLWGQEIGDKGTQHIAESLSMLPTCTKVELLDCGVGIYGCASLCKSLSKRGSSHVSILRLDHNRAIGSEGVHILATALQFNSTLHTLSLNYCNIDYTGGIHFKNILETEDIGIRSLSLEGNDLTSTGVLALISGMYTNRSLESLNLACNNFGQEGDGRVIVELTQVVEMNKRLQRLNIDGNLITNEDVKFMCENLIHATHLYELNITQYVNSEYYTLLMERIDANRPKPIKKKRRTKKNKKKVSNAVINSTSSSLMSAPAAMARGGGGKGTGDDDDHDDQQEDDEADT